MNKKQPIQYTLSVPDKTGPFPLIEFEWGFSYEDVISCLKNIQLVGDIAEYDINKERVDVALKSDSLFITPFCVFRIKSLESGDLSEYVYFVYDKNHLDISICIRLIYSHENNLFIADFNGVNDFFNRDSRFFKKCYLNLHDDSVLLFNFFCYHARLCCSGDYKGSFSEFLECDEILDYINYFKMIEY